MIDSVRLRSPEVPIEVAAKFLELCKCRRQVDVHTGMIDWEFFNGTLVGSYDNRISVKLVDRELYTITEHGKTTTHSRQLENFKIEVECSLHKAMLGHNVIGGSSRFREQVCWLISTFEELIQVSLPNALRWNVLRIDTAEIFQVNPEKYFRSVGHLYYPRKGERGIKFYGNESFDCSTTMVYLKCYDKGKEFKTNGYLSLSHCKGKAYADFIQNIANGILRIEVELRHKKLKKLYDKEPLVADIVDDDLKKVWDEEVAKLLQFNVDFKKSGEVYNTSEKVRTRLLDMCESQREARTLLGTWTSLATFGEKVCQDMICKSTLMRHKARLKQLSISWIGTDIILLNEEDPMQWIPVRSDSCCIDGEAPEVVSLLDKFTERVRSA